MTRTQKTHFADVHDAKSPFFVTFRFLSSRPSELEMFWTNCWGILQFPNISNLLEFSSNFHE